MTPRFFVESLAQTRTLADLLAVLHARDGSYDLVAHWQQGEFHHDVVVRLAKAAGAVVVLVISTNCNGGVKEVTAFDRVPTADDLWAARCGERKPLAGLLAGSRTVHWFDPCELLGDDARSEIRPEFRERQPGGGWRLKASCGPGDAT